MLKNLARLAVLTFCTVLMVGSAVAAPFIFNTGSPDGRIGLASRPGGASIEIESADDFILPTLTMLNGATFTGLIPEGLPVSDVNFVGVEIYRVFPLDSVNPPSGNVPTRTNSPSDNAFDSRDTTAGNLSFTTTDLGLFSASNSILNGINKIPNQTTGGEGAIRGEEIVFNINFTTPLTLDAGHYFFVPQVGLTTVGDNFFWLSTTGPAQFTGDLQSWIRNANLDPDWLRAGTDIVGGANKFDQSFSLAGEAIPEPSTILLAALGILLVSGRRIYGYLTGLIRSN